MPSPTLTSGVNNTCVRKSARRLLKVASIGKGSIRAAIFIRRLGCLNVKNNFKKFKSITVKGDRIALLVGFTHIDFFLFIFLIGCFPMSSPSTKYTRLVVGRGEGGYLLFIHTGPGLIADSLYTTAM